MKFDVFGFGFVEDGEAGVGVFPESEKIFVGSEGTRAGEIGIGPLGSFGQQSIGAGDAEMRQGAGPAVPHDAAMNQNFLDSAAATFASLKARRAFPWT